MNSNPQDLQRICWLLNWENLENLVTSLHINVQSSSGVESGENCTILPTRPQRLQRNYKSIILTPLLSSYLGHNFLQESLACRCVWSDRNCKLIPVIRCFFPPGFKNGSYQTTAEKAIWTCWCWKITGQSPTSHSSAKWLKKAVFQQINSFLTMTSDGVFQPGFRAHRKYWDCPRQWHHMNTDCGRRFCWTLVQHFILFTMTYCWSDWFDWFELVTSHWSGQKSPPRFHPGALCYLTSKCFQ